MEINSPGDQVFDKEQAEFDQDIQNPFIKDESIEFPKGDSENVIENNDYINNTNSWSLFNASQQDLGQLSTFNWITNKQNDRALG